jgi:probable F420-dependent oxidoreductase
MGCCYRQERGLIVRGKDTSIMAPHHPFRFGVVAAQAPSADAWIATARRAEELGFSTFSIPDTLGPTFAPLPALTAVAVATRTIRVGPYVLANDVRNPILLAREAATLDFLSDGRLELGLGAGRPGIEADYRKLGIPLESGAVRVERLIEAVGILKALLSGEQVNVEGKHYRAAGADIFPHPIQQPHPPILIAGAGRRMLTLAAQEADIVALGVHPNQGEAVFQEKVNILRAAAGARFDQIELNVNLAAVGDQLHPWAARQFGLDLEQLRQIGSPSVLLGTPAEMCELLQARRERLGISYVNCGADMMETLAPVVARLAGR